MSKLSVIFLTSAIFAVCESSAIIEKIHKKCGTSDNQCLESLYNSILQEACINGIPDLGIPDIDPYVTRKHDIIPFGMVNMTSIDGITKGIKSCHGSNFKNDIENQNISGEVLCDLISIKENYKVASTPTLLALIGDIIQGEGKAEVLLEKFKIIFSIAYEIKKYEDFELHFVMKIDESSFTYNFLGKAMFSADNILVGKLEISSVAVNIINENWNIVFKILGDSVVDMATRLYYDQIQIFLDAVPAKDLTTDDLIPYVKS